MRRRSGSFGNASAAVMPASISVPPSPLKVVM